MPLGGATILWNEASPAEADVADAGPIRSIETSIRNALGSEHNWPASGGANTGYHLLGSARPFYDVQSNVSSSGSDGRIMLTSDTSRLFGVGSGGTVLVGGPGVLSMGSFPGGAPPQRSYWAEEVGTNAGGGTITFPNSGYSGIPYIWVSMFTEIGANNIIAPVITAITATTFSLQARNKDGSTLANSTYTTLWRSLGTRTL